MNIFVKLAAIRFDAMLIVAYCSFLLYPVVVHATDRRQVPHPAHWLVQISAILLPPLAITVFGRYQFGGFDHSLLVDLGYRQMQGQAPYRDFMNTTPAFFSLGARLAMQWFGMKWIALVYICALAALVANIWLTSVLFRVTGHLIAASLCSATVTTMTMVVTSYWWYNQITALSGIIFLASCWGLLGERPGKLSWLSYTLALTLLAGMKPNVAGLLIAGCVLILWFTRPKIRLTLASLSALAFVLFNMILHMSVRTNLLELLQSYAYASERGLTELSGFRDINWRARFLVIPLVCIALLPLIVLFYRKVELGQIRPQLYLCLLGCFVAIYAMFANMELKLNDLVFMVFSCFLLAHVLAIQAPEDARTALRLTGASLIIFTINSGISGGLRERVAAIGPGAFFEDTPAVSIESGFFAGCHMSPTLVATVKQVEELVAREPAQTYYFGPRMEFLYCVTQRPSPPRLPLWLHPGSSYPVKNEDELLIEWNSQKFSSVVYRKDDYTYHSAARMKLLVDNYYRDEAYSMLTVMRRRK